MLSSRECSSKPSTDRPTGLYLNPEYALMNSGRRCRIPLCKYKLIYLPHQSKLLMKRWRTNGETENCCCFCTWDFLVNVWSYRCLNVLFLIYYVSSSPVPSQISPTGDKLTLRLRPVAIVCSNTNWFSFPKGTTRRLVKISVKRWGLCSSV